MTSQSEARATKNSPTQSEEHLSALLQALPALIVTTTPAGEIEEISASYREYTGLTLEEARDWSLHEMIHPDDLEQAMQVWSRAIASGQPMQNEMRLRRHDGVYRWHLVQGKPLMADDGGIARWVTVSLDIEERKRAEIHQAYLAETTARLVSPLGSVGMLQEIARLAVPDLADICAIGLFDGSTRTVRVETAGMDEREAPHVAAIHLRAWRVAAGNELTMGDQISAGLPSFVPDFSVEHIYACAPNDDEIAAALEIRPRSVICVPLTARGETIGMGTFATTRSMREYSLHDLTLLTEVAGRLSIAIENLRLYEELRSTADELRRANNAKDEFLGLVSHELRSPLTTVHGNAELLLRSFDAISPEDRTLALRDIASESNRLGRIVENLLVLARLDQGKSLESEPVIVARVFEHVIARHRRSNPGRDYEIVEHGAPTIVSFVELYLEQVIENFIANAEKYSPVAAPIVIEIQRGDDRVTVSVLDRGPGIKAEDMDHLFEPFYRSEATSGQAAGLGIGLSVCKRLVEAQGGTIWARPRPGGGSEFGFSLPSIEDGEHAARVDPSS